MDFLPGITSRNKLKSCIFLNNPISDTCVALGTARNATEAAFYFFLEKCVIYFWSAKIVFLGNYQNGILKARNYIPHK
jgi:hypothetical protein